MKADLVCAFNDIRGAAKFDLSCEGLSLHYDKHDSTVVLVDNEGTKLAILLMLTDFKVY